MQHKGFFENLLLHVQVKLKLLLVLDFLFRDNRGGVQCRIREGKGWLRSLDTDVVGLEGGDLHAEILEHVHHEAGKLRGL